MELINEKLILAYGLNEDEEEKLNSLLSKQNMLPCKVIEKNMGNVTIKEVLENIESEKNKIELPHEKLLLFNSYKDKELYDLIDSIRQIKSSNTILAAVTPTSINWTVNYLMQHLIEEREAYRKME
ncbi:DUF3783 domain-containing protein [Clostridium sp. CM028]|uniref:DUF3783 domain-containing protein n=1 Tax=unclassified Clostridium TaxID=2614128 RepID=UPI001C0D07E7|nr:MULTISPECIES: DUF3783 domain-containing protein [unclassified Clostridium]MBU3093032.1 DUF3783 domain-containing protein [Clostridium sp. CF011]MBW9145012.1 DUF3783 domain-containing protein [Clostridium sp. CM027]MBW9148578.1 DUF3783 domain-containing protein [Clostridium sp. CM028]UVE40144.1 DUF3783 domain-containing protein [Clostridium sp. CM027]WAG69089.1 DUF3783 domain-containing protein [Clostridium sp. CF011]